MIAAAIVPHFQPKSKKQYLLMMAVLVGLSAACIGGVVWFHHRASSQIPPVIRKATALYEERKYDEAVGLLVPVIQEIERARGPEDTSLVKHFDLLASVYGAMRKEAEAEPLWRRAYEIRRKNLGVEHPESIGSGDKLALCMMAEGKFADAEPILRKSLAHREAYYGPEDPSIMPSLHHLAAFYLAQRKYAEAEPFASRAVKIGRSKVGLIPPSYADSQHDLGAALAGLDKLDDALPLYEAAVKAKERLLPQAPHIPPKPGQISHGDFADLCKEYAAVLRRAGKEKDAKTMESKAELVLHPKE